jgi:hypothetical protein
MAGQTTNYLFDYPTSTDYVKDGATAIQTLATDVDTTLFTALGGAYPGLRLVKKQTIGSGVSSVNVTSAFSATYENYKIIVNGGVGSATTAVAFKLGASTTTYNEFLIYGNYSSATVGGAAQSTSPHFGWAGGCSANGIYMNIDLQSPFLAKYTRMGTSQAYIGETETGTNSGLHKTATSYTDFTITPTTGTLTGGTIYVYGYGIS